MEKDTLSMLFLFSFEIVIVLMILVWLLRRKNINLRLQLAKVLEKLNLLKRQFEKVTNIELTENNSKELPINSTPSIEDYIKKALIQSQDKLDEIEQSTQALDASQQSLIEANSLRVAILEYELRVISNDSFDDSQWLDLINYYQDLIPKSILAEEKGDDPLFTESGETDNTEFCVLDDADSSNHGHGSEDSDSGESILTASTDEINRLRDIMGRQSESIDQLKKSFQALESSALSTGDGNHEQMENFKEKVQLLEHEQEQMNMCITVLDAENLRLKDIISQTQGGEKSIEALPDSHSLSEDNSNSDGRDLEKALLEAENLIRNLTKTNREYRDALQIMETEMQSYESLSEINKDSGQDTDDLEPHDVEKNSVGYVAEDSLNRKLKDTTKLIQSLIQANKEQLQYIAVIESENDTLNHSLTAETDLAGDLISADVAADAAALDSARKENAVELEQLKSDLIGKIAEFELLEMDYTAIKQKYITLFQEKRA